VVWALDRFSREGVAETFAHIQRLHSYGVGLVSVTEPHFRTTGPAGELMIAVAAWIAKQERIRIQERVRAGLERARKNGTKTGQPIGRPRAVFHRDQVARLRLRALVGQRLRGSWEPAPGQCAEDSTTTRIDPGCIRTCRVSSGSFG
jgi:DNA invertase Pin-like site-specific DNA recombinase